MSVIRSNYDWTRSEQEDSTRLYKIHGCVSQDAVDGHRGKLVLTERDYDEYSEYRETLFASLQQDLLTRDVLIVGQSLRDRHLKEQMLEAARLKEDKGAPGRIFGLAYERDDARAELMAQRGISVAFAGIDEFCDQLVQSADISGDAGITVDPTERLLVKPSLRTAAVDVDQALSRSPDPVRLFNGSPASYADISDGLTFPRSVAGRFARTLLDDETRFAFLTGVAGVGKTTLARQVLCEAVGQGHYAWEHIRDFPLRVDDWLDVDTQLTELGRTGVLLIDDCAGHLREVNRLARELAARSERALKLVLTATTQQWRPRLKDPAIFAHGRGFALSELDDLEIDALVRLASDKSEIRALVDPGFAVLSPREKRRRLKDRARADMFVCLKNVFAAEQLDAILLREYADLDETQQDIYRFVAALEAMGGRVHRQLVLRLMDGVRADEVGQLLVGLEGLVEETTISEPNGLYAWQTRHEVIAQLIAKYKYSDQDELYSLIDRVIDALNPAVRVELRSLRDMCNAEFGISTLVDDHRQLELYEKMIAVAPSERIPRHRVIRKHLEAGDIEGTDQAIRHAEDVVGLDRPINRFKVKLAILRAEKTPGILLEDRRAMLSHAQGIALRGIDKFGDDRLTYTAYADVGIALARLDGDLSMLDDAVRVMEAAAESFLDPAFAEDLLRLERTRERLRRQVQ